MLKQSPGAGATIDKGSTVTLAVAKQPQNADVTDVTGETQNDAANRLSKDGFQVKIVEQPVDSQEGDGVVIGQDPAGGTGEARVHGDPDRRTIRPQRGPGQTTPTTSTPTTATPTTPTTAVRVAVLAGGRSSEHEVSLDSAGVGRRRPARGRPRGRAGRARARRDVAPRRRRDRADARPRAARRRRRVPGAPRAVRRGRHGPGPARAARRPVRRLGRAAPARCAWTRSLFKELDGRHGLPQVGYVAVDEGVLDGAVGAHRGARAAVLGQAGAARLVGRDRAGGRRAARSRARCRPRSATTRG